MRSLGVPLAVADLGLTGEEDIAVGQVRRSELATVQERAVRRAEVIGHSVIAFDDDLEVAPGDPRIVDDEVRARRGAAEGVRALSQRLRAAVDAHTGLDGALARRRAGCGRADGGGRT